ncbi:hypothetical protein C4573_04030 [Candidatus Woesearchaeota archaeon]|nr:MAG: hypothetical protein C4573_04030 [Candidatus Woesearchaeota archaeon]
MKKLKISEITNDPVINIALDTIALSKQALIFVSAKRSAEAQAEKIAGKIKNVNLDALSEQILNALSKPTKQCVRLSNCVKKGIAFHHAGLPAKQRDLIESAFKEGTIKIICATPTLAMGINLPSFRTIVRDLKRYSHAGLVDIPVLEYMQYIGRSGRPDFNDTYGEAVTLAQTESERKRIKKHYLEGKPEEIYSKLAVEPILRTYVLSLIATEFCTTKEDLLNFFQKTFYGFQYGDIKSLQKIIEKILVLLEEWEFIRISNELQATPIGKRVSELYLDPYTAFFMMECLRKISSETDAFAYLDMLTNCLEMRPLLHMKMSEFETIQEKINKKTFLHEEPSPYDENYDTFLNAFKTALFLEEWLNEKDEDYLLEKYNVRPGEIFAKLERADWLVYSAQELVRMMKFHQVRTDLAKLRIRLKYGVKEELLVLLRLKNIGRVRARVLYRNNITSLEDIKKADLAVLTRLLGKSIAEDVKKQVGMKEADANLGDYE